MDWSKQNRLRVAAGIAATPAQQLDEPRGDEDYRRPEGQEGQAPGADRIGSRIHRHADQQGARSDNQKDQPDLQRARHVGKMTGPDLSPETGSCR